VVDRHAPIAAGAPYVNALAFAYFVPVFLTWLAITGVMRQLALLDHPPAEGLLDHFPVRTLTVRFFLAGAILFAAAALTQPSIARFFKLPHADTAGPLLNVFAYFLIGVLLLSRLEYDAMRHRWQAQRTVISAGMAARWTRYAVLFAAAVALLAFVLPTSQTLGILGPGRDAWNLFLLFLRGPLLHLLSLLHPTGHPTKINPHLKPPPGFHLPPRRPPTPHHGGGQGGSWYAAIQTLLFWVGVAAVAAYLVRAYIRRGRRSLGRPRLPGFGGVGRALARLWSKLFRRLRSLLDAASDRLPNALSARLVAPSLRGRHAAGTPLSGPTRQQILAYYRRMVRQAERHGVRRTAAQTPEEFAALLSPQVPQAAGDVVLLTEAFVEARYSRHEIDPGRLGPIRAGWERIREALSARR
jgi:hypothetical protein